MSATPPAHYEPVWLVNEGRVLASAQLASTRAARRRGLIGQTEIHEALVLQPCKWVHSFGMKMAIDVAYLNTEGIVVCIETLRPWRVASPVWKSRTVVEAAHGAFERWGLHLGDVVEVRHAK
jgi:uncharacterized membrane protein (UPF0127 family)